MTNKFHFKRCGEVISPGVRVLVIIFLVVLLIGTVSARDWDNKINYENNDLKVRFSNTFLKIFETSEIGTAELKSHKTVNEVRTVFPGEPSMWYDFDFVGLYENGLGDVEFKDMKNQEEVIKDYSFVYWGEDERKVYGESCFDNGFYLNGTTKQECKKILTGTEIYETWLPYTIKDIPKGKIRIGMIVNDLEEGERLDAIWTISGKRVTKHAEFVGATLYEYANTGADAFNYNSNPDYWFMQNFTIGTVGANEDFDLSGLSLLLIKVGTPTGTWNFAIYNTTSGVPTGTPLTYANIDVTTISTVEDWYNVSINGSQSLYAGEEYTIIAMNDALVGIDGSNYLGWKRDTLDSYAGGMQSLSINANITASISYPSRDIMFEVWGIPSNLTITLNSPADEYISPSNEIKFNVTANVKGGAYLTNMSLYTNETGSWAIRNSTVLGSGLGEHLNSGDDASTSNGGNPNSWFAQTFNVSETSVLDIISVKISKTGTPAGNVDMQLYATDSGDSYKPTGAILSHGEVAFTSISAEAYYNFTMDSSFELQSGTTYALVLNSTSDVGNYFNLKYDNHASNSYADGILWFSSDAGSSWGNLVGDGDDMMFEVWTDGPSTYTGTWNRTLTDTTLWNVQACDSDGDCGFSSENRTVTMDADSPQIVFNYGNGTQSFGTLGINHTLNFTVTDSNLDACWIDYNGTNRTIGCSTGVEASSNFTLVKETYDVTVWANDSVGNLNSSATSFDFRLFNLSESFTTPTTSGATNSFIHNFETNGTDITVAYLYYNNTMEIGTINSTSNNFTVTRSQIAPVVSVATNVSFYWVVNMADGFQYNLTTNNQTVNPIILTTTCTGNTTIYNFTVVDEITQNPLGGAANVTNVKIDVDLYSSDRSNLLAEYYNEFTSTNPAAFCITDDLSGGGSYSLDVQVQYSAENYSKEFYNIERYVLNSSTTNQNVTLYDLTTADTQNFRLLARDSSYLPIDGALIKIDRKYIQNGSFYTTEIPKTDEKGITAASLQTEDVIYNFYIYDDGTLISTFTNVIAVCQTPLVTQCEIDFNAFSTRITVPDYEHGDDFSFTLGYNDTSKVISSVFTIPSGTPAYVTLNVSREDALGTSVCVDTLTSTSGTLTCTVPNSFGNSTVIAKLYKDGLEMGKGNIKLDQNPSDIFGVILIVLSVMVLMTLMGVGLSDSPVVTGVFLFLGVVLLFAMNLVKNSGFIGATATILFLGIAIVLVIIKAAKRT